MSSEYLTAHRQFEIDSRKDDAIALVEAQKQFLELEAQEELYARLENTLADFQTWPFWTVENGNISYIDTYKLTMKVVFKP